jgi:hypothetical protein
MTTVHRCKFCETPIFPEENGQCDWCKDLEKQIDMDLDFFTPEQIREYHIRGTSL